MFDVIKKKENVRKEQILRRNAYNIDKSKKWFV